MLFAARISPKRLEEAVPTPSERNCTLADVSIFCGRESVTDPVLDDAVT